jgi:hypothetical protein
MFEMIFHYDFIIRDKKLRGASTGTKAFQATEHPPTFPGSNIKCDLSSVHSISMTDNDLQLKVFLNEELFGVNGNLSRLMDESHDIALIEGCPGHWFLARTEPSADGMLGFTIVTHQHKTRFIGRGDVVNVDGHGQRLYVTFQTMFPFKSSNPAAGTAHGSAAGGPKSPTTQPADAGADGG